MNHQRVTIEQIGEFDEIIDVRTPLEFAEDHVPGAINAPVLSNEERVIVGTMYKESPFDATRVGAALAARNIAKHLDTIFADRPRNWRPLIYCWRGGKRSGSMTAMFNMIGWRARQLEGGYKAYRHTVVEALGSLPAAFRYLVLAGPTGSGKTRLLKALGAAGAQILDLEGLAAHRGSLLGALPTRAQPAQKSFDTALVQTLRAFDPAQPVFVEAESRRIGAITLPVALVEQIHDAPCIVVEVAREERVALLLEEYGHLLADHEYFREQLVKLTPLHGRERIQNWCRLLDEGGRAELSEALIAEHYDPAYTRSTRRHYPKLAKSLHFAFQPMTGDTTAQAQTLLGQLRDMPDTGEAQDSEAEAPRPL
ncbi:Selenophosphate-dependent tRNA 2-selenouridine synthase [Paraburkholderia unamae]|uniref:tRNA 2-selenouridine(34) synthase MnmH n=1 Tax=Paraburkholderia unamae TaxID=219649 RepID=UPI000DC4D6A6|nr:tRNA 2-selenouridine(34) synthase MnmH [Paraburkholderia unamae]RAR56902.1 tRNA 2-selenouridine synthase [Paraburkholderia unamae]CAG9245114.1 Selenophosphate-dependent tRNA 2-selenouridine synthase [Paraburkholderia unamae]